MTSPADQAVFELDLYGFTVLPDVPRASFHADQARRQIRKEPDDLGTA